MDPGQIAEAIFRDDRANGFQDDGEGDRVNGFLDDNGDCVQ